MCASAGWVDKTSIYSNVSSIKQLKVVVSELVGAIFANEASQVIEVAEAAGEGDMSLIIHAGIAEYTHAILIKKLW